MLLEREVIYTEDVETIFGKRAWVSRSEEILEQQNKANSLKEEEESKAEETLSPTQRLTQMSYPHVTLRQRQLNRINYKKC